MAQKHKYIKPQFLYTETHKKTAVYLTMSDFEAFMKRLEKLSNEAKHRELIAKKDTAKKSTCKKVGSINGNK